MVVNVLIHSSRAPVLLTPAIIGAGYAGSQRLAVSPENILIVTPVEGIMLAMQCLLSLGLAG